MLQKIKKQKAEAAVIVILLVAGLVAVVADATRDKTKKECEACQIQF